MRLLIGQGCGNQTEVSLLPLPSAETTAIFLRRIEHNLMPMNGGLGVEDVLLFDKGDSTRFMDEVFALLEHVRKCSGMRIVCRVDKLDEVPRLKALEKVFGWCIPSATVAVANLEAVITTRERQAPARGLSAPSERTVSAGDRTRYD